MAYETTIDALVERANSDTDFRDKLLADPRGTIEAELELQIPPDWDIAVALDADGGLTIDVLNDEISDELLASVSAGTSCRGKCVLCGGPSYWGHSCR